MLATQVSYWNYKENQRHNFISEDQGQQSIDETKRHNVKSEQQTDYYNAEIRRHNVASEQELFRHNIASENEAYRHNTVSEALGFQTLQETTRHNYATEEAQSAQAQAALSQSKSSQLSAQAAYKNAATNESRAKAQNTLDRSARTLNATRVKDLYSQMEHRNAQQKQNWINSISNAGSAISRIFQTLK